MSDRASASLPAIMQVVCVLRNACDHTGCVCVLRIACDHAGYVNVKECLRSYRLCVC